MKRTVYLAIASSLCLSRLQVPPLAPGQFQGLTSLASGRDTQVRRELAGSAGCVNASTGLTEHAEANSIRSLRLQEERRAYTLRTLAASGLLSLSWFLLLESLHGLLALTSHCLSFFSWHPSLSS